MSFQHLILIVLLSFFTLPNAFSDDWKLTPHFYSRGGVTQDSSLSKSALGKEDFNLGAWGDESNAIRNNLTEITVEAQKGNNLRYTYGFDVDQNTRYYNGKSTPLNERLNFIEILSQNQSLWFGSRAYRGDGDYLIQNFPLDEQNMFGGGVRYEKVGPVNLEFAYGTRQESFLTNPGGATTVIFTRNIFIQKIEVPLDNGKFKTNIELHKINANESALSSNAYVLGAQWQRWGDKVLDGNMYNILVASYSHGNINGGFQQSAFNSADNSKLASKTLLKWGGDWKWPNYGAYYSLQYQKSIGSDSDQKWSVLDFYLRPVVGLTTHTSAGIDLATRSLLDEAKTLNWGTSLYGASRWALMLSYNPPNTPFDNPSVRLFAGQIWTQMQRAFFDADHPRNSENFIRLDYEVGF